MEYLDGERTRRRTADLYTGYTVRLLFLPSVITCRLDPHSRTPARRGPCIFSCPPPDCPDFKKCRTFFGWMHGSSHLNLGSVNFGDDSVSDR